jgi:hypothetical protein
MRRIVQLIILVSVCSLTVLAQENFRMYINNLNMPLDNRGKLADVNIFDPNPVVSGPGAKYNGISFLYSGGFYLSGYTGNTLWANGVAGSFLVQDYLPGAVGSFPGAPENIIYVVAADDPPFGQSWQDWINAVALGADFYDGDGDGIYNPVDKNNNGIWDPDEDKPDMLGDVTAWCVYNDAIPGSQKRWLAEPQGIEIHQTVFAYKNSHPQFSNTINTIFVRYRLLNKGTVSEKLDTVYFSIFSDFDLGDHYDDIHGCDTSHSGVYIYNDGPDISFGQSPPSVFNHYNQFPHVFIAGETFIDINSNGMYDPGIDTPLDTAYSYRGPDLGVRIIPGAKNTEFTSSVFYVSGFSVEFDPPSSITHARNNMLGLTRGGNIHNPCTSPISGVFGGVNCSEINPLHWVSGDPVTNTGWISTTAWDIYSVGSTGPFELHQNDYYDVIVAYSLGEGSDAVNSITVARGNVMHARNAYLSNFGQFPVSVDDQEFVVNDFQLYQNYPNPFNPSTKISWQSPVSGWQTLKVFDVLGREVATLVDEYRDAGSYEVEFNASRLASGIYFYQLNSGNFTSTKKMILLR